MQPILAAFGAGAVLAVQALVNSRFGALLGGPIRASMLSLQIGAATLFILQMAARAGLPSGAQLASVPWWGWSGGLLGAGYLTGALFSVGRIGAASTVALVVFGQMAASMTMDHFGILVMPHPISLPRLLGAGLLVAGVVLITRS
jgi:transporter family-2 protein